MWLSDVIDAIGPCRTNAPADYCCWGGSPTSSLLLISEGLNQVRWVNHIKCFRLWFLGIPVANDFTLSVQCPLCWFLLLANTMPFDLGATFLFSDIFALVFASVWKCIVRRKQMWHLLIFKSCGIPKTAEYATWVTLLINRGKQSTSRAVDFGMDLFQSISQWSQHNCRFHHDRSWLS